MKLITRDVDYALRALCFIVKEKRKVVSVSDLVEQLKMPRPFLRKLLQVLNKESILKSHKGKGGGFVLAKPANKIFLVDLIETFHGPLQFKECLFKKILCPNTSTCILRKKLDDIEKYIIKKLRTISISSLMKGKIG